MVIASGAGALPGSAQDLTTAYPTQIDGILPGQNDVNMFQLDIFYPSLFSAIAVPLITGIPDTELFLFDSGGNPVYMNDDMTGSDTLSCLPSVVSNPCPSSPGGLGPSTPGIYYLAITRALQLPQDAGSNYLFTYLVSDFTSTDIQGPAGGTGSIAGWDGLANTAPNYDANLYAIDLTGTVPEPGSGLLMAAIAGAWAIRRKLTA